MYKGWGVAREVPAKYVSQVVAELKFQHGDADGETLVEVPVAHDDVVAFANFLELCMNTSYEAEGGPGYKKLSGYQEFGEDYFPPDMHYQCMAKLEKYQFYFYNGHGMKSIVYLETE